MSDDRPAPDEDQGAEYLRRWQQSGDREALDALLREEIVTLKARVRHRGRGIVRSPASVSDVVNEGVLRVLKAERLPEFEDVVVFRAYLWRAAWRLLLDRLRVRDRAVSPLDENATHVIEQALAVRGGQSAVEREETTGQMAMAMALLDADPRRVLDLRFLQQKPVEEVAEELGISVDAARKRIVRAVKQLETKLRSWKDLVGE